MNSNLLYVFFPLLFCVLTMAAEEDSTSILRDLDHMSKAVLDADRASVRKPRCSGLQLSPEILRVEYVPNYMKDTQLPTRRQQPGQIQQPDRRKQPGRGQQPGQSQQPGPRQQPGQRQQPDRRQQPSQSQQPDRRQQPGQRRQPGQSQQPGRRQQPGQRRQPGRRQQPTLARNHRTQTSGWQGLAESPEEFPRQQVQADHIEPRKKTWEAQFRSFPPNHDVEKHVNNFNIDALRERFQARNSYPGPATGNSQMKNHNSGVFSPMRNPNPYPVSKNGQVRTVHANNIRNIRVRNIKTDGPNKNDKTSNLNANSGQTDDAEDVWQQRGNIAPSNPSQKIDSVDNHRNVFQKQRSSWAARRYNIKINPEVASHIRNHQ